MAPDLVGYLLDTLDLDEQKAVEEQLEKDPELRRQLELLRQATCPLATDDVIEPPAGLAERAFAAIHQVEVVPVRATEEWTDTAPKMRAVDFIVAASILAIAATLVFPAIASIRGDQARILCAEQLRKIGVALAMYSKTESGQAPYVAPSGPTSHAGIFAMSLKARELIDDPKTFLCPAANNGVVLLPDLDQYLASLDNPPRLTRLRRYMSGSYGYMLGHRQAGSLRGFEKLTGHDPVVADRPPRQDEILFTNSPNHQDRGQNVLYGDGSVRWLPSRIVDRDDLYRNRNCEVAAGLDRHDVVIGVSEATPMPMPEL